jgi:hypothetical protein
MTTYHIPNTYESNEKYYDAIAMLPWVFTGEPGFQVDPNAGLVTANGTVEGFEVVIVPAKPSEVLWTKTILQFRNMFTFDEKRAIYSAAKVNIDIQIWLDDLASASEVRSNEPETIAGVKALETAGLIALGRANEILKG